MIKSKHQWDAIIVGAGAAGLMCAATAGLYGKRTLVLEHTRKIAEKIRISGGGRCNFTNLNSTPGNFLSHNPHYCKSALSRYTPFDFLELVERHGIGWQEKAAGQLFAEKSAHQIIQMLLDECAYGDVQIWKSSRVTEVKHTDNHFILSVETEGKTSQLTATALVIATGGKSIPKIGATGWGYDIAAQFGLRLIETRAGLVPFTFDGNHLNHMKALSGIAIPYVTVTTGEGLFRDALLYTHRGLSGPAILQASSYWEEGTSVTIDMIPDHHLMDTLKQVRTQNPKQHVSTFLKSYLPQRLSESIVQEFGGDRRLADCANSVLESLTHRLKSWCITPSGTEGYRTAEVTLGGVDTRDLSSKTMQALQIPHLYFIGEVVDVTGHLGGHNFQWAWASGHVAGHTIAGIN